MDDPRQVIAEALEQWEAARQAVRESDPDEQRLVDETADRVPTLCAIATEALDDDDLLSREILALRADLDAALERCERLRAVAKAAWWLRTHESTIESEPADLRGLRDALAALQDGDI